MITWTTWHHFVLHDRAGDYLRLGWCPSLCDRSPALDGTPHGQYSVLMSWICQCLPIEPKAAEQHSRQEPGHPPADAHNANAGLHPSESATLCA